MSHASRVTPEAQIEPGRPGRAHGGWVSWLAPVLASVPALTLAMTLVPMSGCGEPSPWHTEEATGPLCERVLQCGGWGYTDTGECEDALVGNPALGTHCADEDGYLDCMHRCCWQACREVMPRDECRACQPPDCNQCDPLGCDDLSACDTRCFADHCRRS